MEGNSVNDEIMEIKRKKFFETVFKICKKRNIPLPKINFWGCAGEDTELAHYHPDEHTICISSKKLNSLNFDQIEAVATHEISHYFEHNHESGFYRQEEISSISSFTPPPGTIRVSSNKTKDDSVSKPIKINKTECNYHLCHVQTKPVRCPHCRNYYCDLHIRPFIPYLFNGGKHLREEQGHPCAIYGDYVAAKKKLAKKRYYDSLDVAMDGKIRDYGASSESSDYLTGDKHLSSPDYFVEQFFDKFLTKSLSKKHDIWPELIKLRAKVLAFKQINTENLKQILEITADMYEKHSGVIFKSNVQHFVDEIDCKYHAKLDLDFIEYYYGLIKKQNQIVEQTKIEQHNKKPLDNRILSRRNILIFFILLALLAIIFLSRTNFSGIAGTNMSNLTHNNTNITMPLKIANETTNPTLNISFTEIMQNAKTYNNKQISLIGHLWFRQAGNQKEGTYYYSLIDDYTIFFNLNKVNSSESKLFPKQATEEYYNVTGVFKGAYAPFSMDVLSISRLN